MRKIFISLTILFFCFIKLNAQITDVVLGINQPTGIVFNGNDLYIAERETGKILKINITDSNPIPEEVVSISAEGPGALTLNDNDLYVGNFSSGGLYKIDITETNPIAVEVVLGLNPTSLKINGNFLYVSSYSFYKTISKIDLTDPNPTHSEVLNGLNLPTGLEFIGNDLYYADYITGKISKINILEPNPLPIEVVSGLLGPNGIISVGNELYICESNGNKISKINILDTNPIVENVVSNLNRPLHIAFKDNELYFSEIFGNKISKINITLSIDENPNKRKIKLFPNPSSHYILISNLIGIKNYKIYNVIGSEILKGEISGNEKIDIKSLNNGLYFIVLDNNESLKFIKK